jgi:hypothetical protein
LGIFRTLGLIGSAGCLLILTYAVYEILFLEERPIPFDEPEFWLIYIPLLLTCFNLVPVTKTSESLIALWIEAKKSELKKRIVN